MNGVKNGADQRIEQLLNECGQTMQDMPTGYSFQTVLRMQEQANEWCRAKGNGKQSRGQYACHLADLVDLMETALINEHARRIAAEERIEKNDEK